MSEVWVATDNVSYDADAETGACRRLTESGVKFVGGAFLNYPRECTWKSGRTMYHCLHQGAGSEVKVCCQCETMSRPLLDIMREAAQSK